MADMVAKLGITVDSSQAVTASDNLDGLARSADKTERATDKLGGKTTKVNKAFKLQKGAVQQAGFQIQDFAVQVSGGTSAMTAFGQQGSQLAGILGPGGAVIGAVIAIGAAIGGVLFNSLNKAGSAAERLADDLEKAGKSFDHLSNAQAIVARREAEELTNTLIRQREELVDLIATYKGGGNIYSSSRKADWEDAEAQLDSVNAAIKTQQIELEALDDVISGKSEIVFFSNISKAYTAYATSRIESNRLIAESETEEEANQAFTDTLLARGSAETEFLNNRKAQNDSYWLAFGEAQLIVSASEQDLLLGKLTDEADYQSRSLNAYREYYGTLTEFKQDEAAAVVLAEKNKLTIQQSLNTVFSTLMQAQSKELFEIGKIGSIGSAINSAYEAINKTLAQGGLFAGPAAAAIGAAAFANVASIASTQYGSKSSGGASTPTIPTAEATEAAPNISNIAISLGGAELFGRETVLQLIGSINEAVGDGATVRTV